jgi:hypothetical protein
LGKNLRAAQTLKLNINMGEEESSDDDDEWEDAESFAFPLRGEGNSRGSYILLPVQQPKGEKYKMQ